MKLLSCQPPAVAAWMSILLFVGATSASAECPTSALEACQDRASEARHHCDNACENASNKCQRANQYRPNALDACSDKSNQCTTRCDALENSACQRLAAAQELCEKREAYAPKLAAAATKAIADARRRRVAKCREREHNDGSLAVCGNGNARKVGLRAEKAGFLVDAYGVMVVDAEHPELVWLRGLANNGLDAATASRQCTGVNFLGGKWRLPTIQEQQSLYTKAKATKNIADVFPASLSIPFWSGSSPKPGYGSVVLFESGKVAAVSDNTPLAVRCVAERPVEGLPVASSASARADSDALADAKDVLDQITELSEVAIAQLAVVDDDVDLLRDISGWRKKVYAPLEPSLQRAMKALKPAQLEELNAYSEDMLQAAGRFEAAANELAARIRRSRNE